MKQNDIESPQLCENHLPKPQNSRRSALFKTTHPINLTNLHKKYKKKNEMMVAQIQKIVKHMPSDDRQLKAERHIYDAYYLRTIRNDIDLADKIILKYLWKIENSRIWSWMLLSITIFYQILTFFEKAFPDSNYQESYSVFIFELVFLIIFAIDFSITFILLATKKNDGGFQFNTKRMLKLIFLLICGTDFINYQYDQIQIRFSRIIRPILMVFYSKDLRRNLKGIIKASQDLILLFLLYLIIISTFSFIGINLIGSLQNVDIDTQDYGDFFKLFNMLFMAATLDFYPDIMIPVLLQGTYYVFFFVVYMILFLFLFQPIPFAIVYEGFRKHRMQIAIQDIIKQKSAMMASFISLDSNDVGFLTENQFKNFLKTFYKGQLTDEQIKIIFKEIDKDFNDKIQFDEFNQLLNVLQNSNYIQLPRMKPLKCWDEFCNLCNKYGLKTLINSWGFILFMLLIIILNCALIIAAIFIDDLEILRILDIIDTIFLGIYIFECLIKIIGIGIVDFFYDGWNIFDVIIIFLQILFDYILFNFVSDNIVQSVKANRILRIAKIQKVFRICKALRSIKLFGYILQGLEIFVHVKNLLYKIMICIPIILRLILPVQIVFFTYACIGIYIYGDINKEEQNPFSNSFCDPNEFRYQWGECKYADFNTMGGSYLIMLQIFTAASWSQIVFELSYDTKNLIVPMIFVGSFVFLSIFLLALVGGLIWEVFTVISKILFEQEIDKYSLEVRVVIELNYQDEVVFGSSFGTDHDINSAKELNNILKLKKKTTILNDDNPDILEFKQRSTRLKVNQDEYLYTPFEILSQIDTKRYNKIINVGRNIHLIQKNQKPQGDYLLNIEESFLEIRKIYCDYFIDFQEFLELKFRKESYNIYNVTTDYVVHIRNEIKKDENYNKKRINISNHDFLIQNAVLRDTDEVYIKKQEEQFLKQEFGQKFELIKELKFQNKFKVESKILFSLMGILKFPKPNIKYFFQILYLIENYFTFQLLPDNSYFKLIHCIEDKWYLISIEDNQIVFTRISNGPWTYENLLFETDQMKICENLKFMKDVKNQEIKYHIKEFHKSLSIMAKQFDIDANKIDVKSTIILYQIKNDTNSIPKTLNQNFQNSESYEKINPQGIVEMDVLQDDQNKVQLINNKYEDIHKHVSQTIIFVLSKIHAQEGRIVYQNQVLLAQFIKDLAGVIKNYSQSFFQQLEDLYTLKIQQRRKKSEQNNYIQK
ncbi:unnamed protein product [Paramecium sonneborni]|uniref:EF-hand domain-containing protein n=1 Tax=Paramecium sonneborni TaxID=65129 RepID=A0A8S1RBL3_9CILI|nr:unnamed protein product [Paramecium sonneborni]